MDFVVVAEDQECVQDDETRFCMYISLDVYFMYSRFVILFHKLLHGYYDPGVHMFGRSCIKGTAAMHSHFRVDFHYENSGIVGLPQK